MKLNIQIKSIAGNILFELEKEDNTIKDTVTEAVKQSADLRGAYLRGADLRGAYLRGAYLGGAGKIANAEDILIIGNIGSRAGYTQVYNTDNGIFVKCGCFFGSIDEFAEKVKKTHGDNKHAQAYRLLIDFAKHIDC